MSEHDLYKPRLDALAPLPGMKFVPFLIPQALALGCPDSYCGRFANCGVCFMANELGVFELMRDTQSDTMKEIMTTEPDTARGR